METVLVARHAMATRFEIVLHGDDALRLRSAGEEALDEVERVEGRLSLYRPTSEIAAVNAEAANRPVRVSQEVFNLLTRAADLTRITDGAFDITVGPLMRSWGLMGETGRIPEAEELAAVRPCVGMHLVELDPGSVTVRFRQPGVMLDLGAIGKGYAIDCAVETLREVGETSAFIHGGTSTSFGMGNPPDADSWRVALDWPGGATGEPLPVIGLRNEALSVSAPSGKSFRAGERIIGHVIDPRAGQPVTGAILSALSLPGATETDALSTALLVAGSEGLKKLIEAFPRARGVVVERNRNPSQYTVHAQNIQPAN